MMLIMVVVLVMMIVKMHIVHINGDVENSKIDYLPAFHYFH